jgi:AcrR family transcriptional regulator
VTATGGSAEVRPLRRDALRNQQRVIKAARDVLAEHGPDATMELIASRAGVGIGTVYRHFPTKDALIDELVALIMSDLTASARAALARADGTGLEAFLRVLGRSFAEHRGYAHLLTERTPARCGAEQLRRLIGDLLEQAKQYGRIGPDIGLGDIMATVWAIRGIIETSAAVTPRAWLRHLDLHLAALGPAAARSDYPAISARQLARISGGNTATEPATARKVGPAPTAAWRTPGS